MANYISMAKEAQILALFDAHHSHRSIAKRLNINRRTVSRCIAKYRPPTSAETTSEENNTTPSAGSQDGDEPKCTIPTAGSLAAEESKCTIPSAGLQDDDESNCAIATAGAQGDDEPKCTISTAGSAAAVAPASNGRKSHCEPFRNLIVAGMEKGQTAELIHRVLVDDHDFKHSYESVKRFVRKLRESGALPSTAVQRLECQPGEEVQVDFGMARTLLDTNGGLKNTNVLRVTLSFSRKGYTETLPNQSTECLIRSLENAFRHFGGVPETIIVDNLKAAVKKADWFDPDINPKFAAFAKHYGSIVLPTRPYTPEHKGKVERDVQYVKSSALKGKRFNSINEQNAHLREWEKKVADTRIHGTTRKQVNAHFQEYEKPALKPLPIDLFPCYQEARRKVHRDARVVVSGAYYGVPPEYIGRDMWARWDEKTVQIYDHQMALIASHVRLQPGQFSECKGARGKPYGSSVAARSSKYYIEEVTTRIGSRATTWAQYLSKNRPDMAIRIMQGLLQLGTCGKHTSADIEAACQSALARGDYSLGYIKDWLKAQSAGHPIYEQEQFKLLDEHEIIREMSVYQQFLEDTEPQAPQ